MKGWGVGSWGGASLYKTLLRTPATSIFGEFLRHLAPTQQGEIIVNKISTVNQRIRDMTITGHVQVVQLRV